MQCAEGGGVLKRVPPSPPLTLHCVVINRTDANEIQHTHTHTYDVYRLWLNSGDINCQLSLRHCLYPFSSLALPLLGFCSSSSSPRGWAKGHPRGVSSVSLSAGNFLAKNLKSSFRITVREENLL